MMITLALSLTACGDSDSKGGGDSGGSNGVSGGTNAGTNASGGSAGSNGAGSGGSPSVCQDIMVSAAPTTPDMLIVLDRSGSMKRGSVNRWDPSVSAVRSVTSELEDIVRFGLMMFPRAGRGGDACEPGRLDVEVEIESADEISRALNGEPSGGTPTGETLEAAFEALDPTGMVPDQVIPPKYVLLVTDGQPTCPAGDGMEPPEQADIDLTTKALDKLLDAEVRTYVIGYDTQDDPAFASLMDTFASHGGTGKHRAVEDEATLVDEIKEIAGEAIPCSYQLDMEPEDPSFVRVTLDGRQLNLGDANGWSINGTVISLEGTSCSSLKDGQQHTVNVQVTCNQVTPL
jgi:hypothetical protein